LHSLPLVHNMDNPLVHNMDNPLVHNMDNPPLSTNSIRFGGQNLRTHNPFGVYVCSKQKTFRAAAHPFYGVLARMFFQVEKIPPHNYVRSSSLRVATWE
jgi:hypothetical protein